MKGQLRIARPTAHLGEVTRMYREGLGFELLGEFTNHDGFDGVMLGHPGADYHLEFTHKRGHSAGRTPNEDHLLVFYIPDGGDWGAACSRAETAGFRRVRSFNPYWDTSGRTFEDPDGCRIVLQNAAWSGTS